jgi:hypothetical protein
MHYCSTSMHTIYIILILLTRHDALIYIVMYSTSIVQYIYNKRKGGEDKESKMKRLQNTTPTPQRTKKPGLTQSHYLTIYFYL